MPPYAGIPKHARVTALGLACLLTVVSAQAPEPARGVRFQTISQTDLREWLTYLASDEMQGRQVFSEGYGAAAQYIAERLREWGVKPLGDNGTYFQIVKLQSYKVTRNSTVIVEGNGRTATFKDGEHVAFPAAAGGRQRVVLEGDAAIRGAIQRVPPNRPRTLGEEELVRAQAALAQANAAVAAAQQLIAEERGGTIMSGRAGNPATGMSVGGFTVDIAPTTQNVELPIPPRLTADDEFFAAVQAAGPAATVTIDVDNTYHPVTTQFSRNVVGMVEGTDARLKDSYVLFGAHLDHVGYAISSADARGQVTTPITDDRIWNGADDDGTGATAQMAIAKAFARGSKPKRSVVFAWHAGEEADLYGSRYLADFPVVPLEKVQAQLNIDMIGRNRDNDPRYANTLFVIGADRISTDLHNLIVGTNEALAAPLTLDYEYNDPADPNSFYTRSDHYSYASKGIPIAFFFTGTHPDYHANSDTVDKILFEKQARIAQLVYQVGYALASAERPLQRDARGPRAGRGHTGILK